MSPQVGSSGVVLVLGRLSVRSLFGRNMRSLMGRRWFGNNIPFVEVGKAFFHRADMGGRSLVCDL